MRSTPSTSRRRLLALVAVSALLVVNAFVLSPLWILAPAEEFTDTGAVPAFGLTQTISWLLVSALVVLLPAVVRPGPHGAPPAWVLPVAQLAYTAQAATHFVQGVLIVWLVPLVPEVLNQTGQGWADVALIGSWIAFLVANVVLAISFWRSGHGRIVPVLMALGAVTTPVVGPFGAGLVAAGLGLAAVRTLRSGSRETDPVATAVDTTSVPVPGGRPATQRRLLTTLLGACAVLAVNGLVLGPLWLFIPGEFSDTAASPAYSVSQTVSWALLTLLVVLVPAVAGTGRRHLPGWALPLAQLALVLQAAIHFGAGWMVPWLADVAPEVLDLTDGGTFMWVMQGTQVLFLLAMVTFAVTLWRAGHSRVGAILMMLGAIGTAGVGPIGAGVLAIGLGLMTARVLRPGATERAAVLARAAV